MFKVNIFHIQGVNMRPKMKFRSAMKKILLTSLFIAGDIVTHMQEATIQAFILYQINTAINKNSIFLNIRQIVFIRRNGFDYLCCKFQII